MCPTVIKDFKVKQAYSRLVQKALFSYLNEGIYKPMFEMLGVEPKKAVNSLDPITQGLKEGSIYYADGAFRAKDKFSAAQSFLLKKWGAVYDSRQRIYKIDYNSIPMNIRVALADSEIQSRNAITQIDAFLKEVQSNIPYIVESMVFNEEVVKILDDSGHEVEKNVKHLNVIVPELTDKQKIEIANSYTNNMQYYIKDFLEGRIPLMREKIADLVLKGYRTDTIQKMLEKEFGIMGRKAAFLAQNETTIMLAEYKRVTYQEMGFDKFIWRTIMDGRERPLHEELNGKIFSYDNPPIIDERTGQHGLPGETYNCLIGEMSIQSPFIHNRIFKRQFRGELTEIVLPMGTLKVTPNHPILTSRGWIPAKFIKKGDQIAKISGKTFSTAGANPNNIKVTIKEFFSFYSVLFETQRVRLSDNDFHGDISLDQQVDIINIENKLGNYIKSGFNKFRLEQLLTKANELGIISPCNRAFFQAFPFCGFPSNSLISSLSKVFSFFFSSKFHSVKHCFRAISWLNSLLFEVTGYDMATNAEFFSQLFNTAAGSIKFYQLIAWNLFFNIVSNNLVSSPLHSNREVSGATAETLSNLCKAKPAFIEFDTVIDKIICKSSNIHIYNLENSNNWYLTENYITKNCRCTAIPYRDDNLLIRSTYDKEGQQKVVEGDITV